MIGVRAGGPRRARLAALGAHVPERVVTNADLERMVDTSDEWIVSRTGIRERRWAAPDEASSDLGVIAARRILDEAGVDPIDIDMVIVPSATPDHLFPATAAIVAHAIGADRAAAYDVLAACSGFIYSLAQAAAMVETGLARRILVVGAEVMSRILDMSDRATCVLFGDAAAGALVVGEDSGDPSGFLGFDLGADGGGADDLILRAGGGRMPMACTTSAADGFLQMKGAEVFRFATRAMVESVTRVLHATALTLDDVDLVIPHQANARIIDHAASRLGIPEEKMFNNLDRYGNTSSASVPLALAEARDQGRLGAGDLVLMVGFGAGLTWASAIARYEPVGVPA
jgi:3-oxoacyl-[acyl-carrier-protein] synthase III